MIANLNKKGNKGFFSDKLIFQAVGLIFLVVIIFLMVTDYKIYQKKKELNSQISTYQKQIEDIKENSETLKEEIANADNAYYLEKIAYEQLGQARPGETVFSFVSSQEKLKTTQKLQNNWDTKSFSGWISGVWNWIKDKF